MKRYKIRVTGKVQGVFFRDTARRVATQLRLNGFARNEQDGSVYVEAEGDEMGLRSFLEWCHKGSERAEVESVGYEEAKPSGYITFEIQ